MDKLYEHVDHGCHTSYNGLFFSNYIKVMKLLLDEAVFFHTSDKVSSNPKPSVKIY